MSPSKTHFIEVVQIERGTPKINDCPCGITLGGETYSIIGDVLKSEPTWFENKKTLKHKKWRLQYLGGKRTYSYFCYGCGDYDLDIGNQREPVDNIVYVNNNWSGWSKYDHRVPTDGINLPVTGGDYGIPGDWKVLNTKQIKQLNNGALTYWLSPDNYIDKEIATNFTVDTGMSFPDDDFIGIIFGAEINQSTGKPRNYYLLAWKKGAQTQRGFNAEAGIKLLKLVNVDSLTTYQVGDRIWDGASWTSGSTSLTLLAQKLNVSWQHGSHYQYNVVYRSDGRISVRVSRILNPGTNLETRQYELIWEETIIDDNPLTEGKYGFMTFSQAGVTFESHYVNRIYFMTTGESGSVCVSGANNISFSGSSDDITIMIHEDDDVIEDYSGFTGDPVTFTVPSRHIIFRDIVGYLINAPYAGRPGTVPKTLISGSNSYTVPRGTSLNTASGHVVDIEAGGFDTIDWGDNIPVTQLVSEGWLDRDLKMRFKFVHIPSGLGHLKVNSVNCDGALVDPGPEPDPDWKIVTDVGGNITVLGQAPIEIGSYEDFEVSSIGPIGVRFDTTPESLKSPKFVLTSLDGLVVTPKQVEFLQENETFRVRGYHYLVRVGDESFSTQNPDHIVYFSADNKIFPIDGLRVEPFTNVHIRFLVPIDSLESVAEVDIIEGSLSASASIPMTPRSHFVWPLSIHRELLSPLERQFTAKTAALKFNVKYNNYDPYLFVDNDLDRIDWDYILQNKERLILIKKGTPTENALAHLRSYRNLLE